MIGSSCLFALAKLPEPCKPESFGMDLLHTVSATQPDELFESDEAPCFPDTVCRGNLTPDDKHADLGVASCSTTDTRRELYDHGDLSDGEDDFISRKNSFYSHGTAEDWDHTLPPNRLLHDHHNAKLRAFLHATWQRKG